MYPMNVRIIFITVRLRACYSNVTSVLIVSNFRLYVDIWEMNLKILFSHLLDS